VRWGGRAKAKGLDWPPIERGVGKKRELLKLLKSALFSKKKNPRKTDKTLGGRQKTPLKKGGKLFPVINRRDLK